MKMTKIESARIIVKQSNTCSNVSCEDCFLDLERSCANKKEKAASYIKRHESKKKVKVKTDVRDVENVVKDRTVKESLKVDPTPLDIVKNIKAKDYVCRWSSDICKICPIRNEITQQLSCGLNRKTLIDTYISEHEKVEPVGNTDKPVIEPLKFDDPVPEYVYMVTDKAIKREKVVSFLQTKDTFKITELIRFDYGGEHTFENCYKTLADAVKVAEEKWSVK